MLLPKSAIAVYLCLKHMAWKYLAYVIKSDIGHKSLKQKLKKNLQTIFASPSKNSNKKEKEMEKKNDKNGNCKAFCFRSKLNKKLMTT